MRIVLAILFSLFTVYASAEEASEPIDWAKSQPHWVKPFEPFRVIGNVYYVGTEGLAVYLITGEDGHALIDGGLAGHEQIIIDNIATLGFDIKDVKYLLNTHAHFDHSGGLAELKRASGAELHAYSGDASALEEGFYLGFEDRSEYAAPPVSVDRVWRQPKDEKDIVMNIFVRPRVLLGIPTPGHSRGCTSWEVTGISEEEKEYNVLIFCSATVAANSLGPEQYEGIIDDYRLTFEKTKDWNPDVFLANHPEVFHMKEAREKQKAGDPLAFVNRGAFQKYIAAKERAFEKALAEQKRAAQAQE